MESRERGNASERRRAREGRRGSPGERRDSSKGREGCRSVTDEQRHVRRRGETGAGGEREDDEWGREGRGGNADKRREWESEARREREREMERERERRRSSSRARKSERTEDGQCVDAAARNRERTHQQHQGWGGGGQLVWYGHEEYHPVQAGSIDGTDTRPHDRGIKRALMARRLAAYDPASDPCAASVDASRTLFVCRLLPATTEGRLLQAAEAHGSVQRLRIVRNIVTGASRGYAFIEYASAQHFDRAYRRGLDLEGVGGRQVLVDFYRQGLLPGWLPRRYGGGVGGRKESGQIRFGCRDRPFKVPLREVPVEQLQKLGIPLPPQGRFHSTHQVPPLPSSLGTK
ncbi:hypothetical protein CLOM_g15526 [Closterium sp. NIES-68]|nr:hypothetical protein CLOM_g15526 [Closterium sp. NIES-68]GJP59035.1 hypothetical protein CLOP_g7092 [Closterium sp. NIES-67]